MMRRFFVGAAPSQAPRLAPVTSTGFLCLELSKEVQARLGAGAVL
jgi:hypothetical protein